MSKGLKPTPEQLQAWIKKGLLKPEDLCSTRTGSSQSQPKSPKESLRSQVTSPMPSKRVLTPIERLNKTELRYLNLLKAERPGAIILPQAVTLILGPDLRYTPDFFVVDGAVFEMHEVKGAYVREDARAKFLAATKQYPFFKWSLAQWVGGGWTRSDYSTHD